MKNPVSIAKALLLFIFITGLTTSCVVTAHPPAKTKTVVVKHKKPHHHHHKHPHGGPPGQTKKAPGHPGKRHFAVDLR